MCLLNGKRVSSISIVTRWSMTNSFAVSFGCACNNCLWRLPLFHFLAKIAILILVFYIRFPHRLEHNETLILANKPNMIGNRSITKKECNKFTNSKRNGIHHPRPKEYSSSALHFKLTETLQWYTNIIYDKQEDVQNYQSNCKIIKYHLSGANRKVLKSIFKRITRQCVFKCSHKKQNSTCVIGLKTQCKHFSILMFTVPIDLSLFSFRFNL